jgi:hypothetical protein
MRTTLLGFVIFSFFGIIVFATQGFGNSLDTFSEVNKINTLKISDSSTKTLLGMNLGTTDDITSITLIFKNSIPDSNTVNISLKDGNDVEIGSGLQVVSPTSTIVTVILSDSITSAERDTLVTASITVT